MTDVRAARDLDEFRQAVGAIAHYFGGGPQDEWIERFNRILPTERTHAAFDGERIVGGTGAFPFELTVPGGTLRAGGVTVVGVLPTHRRRGVLREMMRVQLEDIRARGEAVAILWASEEPIYTRFGYGLASLACEMDLSRSYAHLAGEPAGSVRLAPADEALPAMREAYERARLEQPGMLGRSGDWWELRQLADDPAQRGGGGEKRYALLELDGRVAAYAIYRMHQSWADGSSSGHVNVIEAIGDSPAATREIWRFLLGIDWTAAIKARLLPIDHPLLHLLAYPRRMKWRVADGLWLRVTDVGAALAGREPGGDVVLDVRDDLLPENAGAWTASGERTDAEPELRLDVRALGSLYLGGFPASELARAGLVEELVPGALRRADAAFGWDRKPWCPEIF